MPQVISVAHKPGQRIRQDQEWHIFNPKSGKRQQHFRSCQKEGAGGWGEVAKRSFRSTILSEAGFNPQTSTGFMGQSVWQICRSWLILDQGWAVQHTGTLALISEHRDEKNKEKGRLDLKKNHKKGKTEWPSQQRTQCTWLQLPTARLKHHQCPHPAGNSSHSPRMHRLQMQLLNSTWENGPLEALE